MNILRKYLLTNVYRAPEGAVVTSAESPAAPAGDPDVAVIELPSGTDNKLNVRSAARLLAKERARLRQETQSSTKAQTEAQERNANGKDGAATTQSGKIASSQEPGAELATAELPTESEPAQAGDDAAAAETQPPGETEEADRHAIAPIDPPRSWTKEDKELFTSLPRETQERLVERERSRERDFNQRQQKATEESKALAAELEKAGRIRQEYEGALPLLLQQLQAQHSSEFADIKTIEDLEKLQQEDPFRYQRWDLQQKKIGAAVQQVQAAQQRQQIEARQRFKEFADKEDNLLTEKVPELADDKKRDELQKASISLLKDVGFTDAELTKAWNGQGDLSLRDHRLLQVVLDGVKWRDAQAKAKTAVVKPVPPVQRPGPAQPKGPDNGAVIANLTKQLETASGMKALHIAAELRKAKRAAAAR